MTDRITPGAIPELAELRLLRRELDSIGNPEATLALLVLLTMQAPGDIALMDWRDVDLHSGTWVLPGRPHRIALLSSATIATLIRRARGGIPREGLVIQAASGGAFGDPPAGTRPLADLLPPSSVSWTIDAVHEAAWAEWNRLIGVDLTAQAAAGHRNATELIRLRHATRLALDEWASLLR